MVRARGVARKMSRPTTGLYAAGNPRVQGSQAAALPRVRKKAGAGESGSGRNRQAAAQVERAQASPVHDSTDSFENHVIDLRGSNVEDEDEVTIRGTQSSEEPSVRNGNASESDSEGGAHANSQWPHPHGKHRNRLVRAQVDNNARQRDNRAREHHFTPGQVTWAKYGRFPWWPAQVADDRDVGEGKAGVRGADTDLLVRFFGTYDYGWVDPRSNLSPFEVKLAERSRIRKTRKLQKGVEEAIAYRETGTLPPQWEPISPLKKKKRPLSKVFVSAEERVTKRKISKSSFQTEEEHRPVFLQRRYKIMRQLGLAAPSGSPFTSAVSVEL